MMPAQRKRAPKTAADLPNIQKPSDGGRFCVVKIMFHEGTEKTYRLFEECGERLLSEFNDEDLDVIEFVHSLGTASFRSESVMMVDVERMDGRA